MVILLLRMGVLMVVPSGALVVVSGDVSIDFVVLFGCGLLIRSSGLLLLRCYRWSSF